MLCKSRFFPFKQKQVLDFSAKAGLFIFAKAGFFDLCKKNRVFIFLQKQVFSIYGKAELFISAQLSIFFLYKKKQFLVLQKQVLTIYALIIMLSTRYRACAAQPWSLREPSMRSGTSKRKWKSSTHRLIIMIMTNSQS